MDLIEVDHLTQDYGHGRGVFDVSFSVAEGEVFGFLGPNGAGKSTVIRHIMGFSKPQRGSVRVFGQESFKNYYKFLDKVGYLPGEIALPEGLTGWEFIDMMAKLRHIDDKKKLNELSERFEIRPAGETKKMSLGVRSKLAIVTAFMADPEVLVLDEPTSGLDPVMQQNFIDFIKDEKKQGKTILLSSHIFNEVEASCQRISIIKDGQIVSTFNANDIKHNQNKKYVITFNIAGQAQKFCDNLPKLSKKIRDYDKIYLENFDHKDLIAVVAVNDKDIDKLVEKISEFDIKDFRQSKYTLEDYFMHFYKEDKKFGGVF